MSFYQDKIVLVTGASGFIGSHLCDHLVQEGATVIGVDNFITGKKKNTEHLLANPRFTFIEADVCDDPSSYLSSVPTTLSMIDCVFHLASPASPTGYQDHPVETYLVNSMGTHNLLQFMMEKFPAARFLYTSTSESYGDPLIHPQTEEYWGNVSPNGPRSMYDESKRLGEAICAVHVRSFNLDVRVVRIFNTYGPRLDLHDGRVIPDFCNSVLEKKPMRLFGDGEQTRSFCYIDDLVRGLLQMMQVDEARGETVNLGNPQEITINALADLLQKISKTTLEKKYAGKRVDDPARRCPDISKAKRLLGWQPQIDLENGLRQTLDFLRSS